HRRSTPGDQPSHPWWLGAPFVWLTVWLSLATIVWGFNHDLREMTRSRPTPMPVAYSSSGPAIIDPIPTADSSTLRLSLASSTNRPADHYETVIAQNGRRYRARRIRDIQTGHRVLARNPQVDSNSLAVADIDPADWVNVRMRLEKPDGGVLNVVLLRPVDWLADRLELWNTFPESDRLDRSASADHGQIPYLPELGDSNESSQQQQVAALHVEVDRPFLTIEQRQATVADALPALAIPEGPASDRLPRERLWIHLDLPEIGAVGRAELVSLEPCPPIEPGQGRIVTGTFAHSSAEVIDIEITGVEEPIGCTANHPFWSEDRQDFVQAGTLRIGENLRSESGTLLQVTRITPRTGPPVEVFNLEVDAEHVYYVSAGGVLVHNAYDIDESLRQLGMGTSSTSSAPSRVYTIYVNGSFHKFGVTDAAGKRLREVVRSLGDVEIAISVSKEMPKYRAHMIEKYLRSLHFNSTGQWHLPGMKYPFPVDFSTGLPIPPPATHFR
ncbi:MAG: polymorphic toxin-type HINT domain-containing protein, partial [Planctomycetota bacterium]|nr:polymorphic toxin-type HINT domain-containing protein [Planctomycetota bacterium]